MESIRDLLKNHKTVPATADALIKAGHHPVPIPGGQKGPQIQDWETKTFSPASFRPGMNIGLRHVTHAIVDNDCAEVLAVDDRFIPATLTTGKESAPRSHWWITPTGEAPAYKKFTDVGGETIVELRFGGNKQTVIPPSVHPDTGGRYVVGVDAPVAEWSGREMRRGVGMLATAGLIARHLPKGGRHDIALVHTGYMLRHKETPADVLKILKAAWDAAGYPGRRGNAQHEAHRDLESIVRDTVEKLGRDAKAYGGRKLAELDPKLPAKIADFLQWKDAPAEGAKDGNQAKRLIGYALEDSSELFLDQNDAPHALADGIPVPLESGCYGWLRRLFWDHEEAAATTDLLGTVAGQLRAFAEVSDNERTLHLRAAQHEGAVYLYLGPGRVVRCDAYGWEIDPNPPVMFRRVKNLKELPNPEHGGSLDLLDAFITAREDRDHRLAKAWLVLALLADVPRPILLAHGPQGATKSSVQRVLKNIIDPAKPETLKLREKDFEQNINKAFIPFFDNISNITDHIADELSKAVTGAGNAVRKLYEDDEDVIREYKRAVLLNGLIIPTEKADLIDRTLPVALKRVPKEERETERRMQALFEKRHALLLGAVLDALSGALANHEEVRGLPRLADWAEYAIALYKHLGWGGYKGFMADWAVIEEGQHAVTLEGSALAQAAVAVVAEHGTVQKSPSEMLNLLHEAAESEGLNPDKDKDFPKHANWVWRKLVPVVPTLESFLITASEGKDADKKRYIRLERIDLPDDPNPEPKGEGQHNGSGDSTEKMLSPSDPHTYGTETTETAETPYFPRNSKYTEEQIDNGEERDVLQGGKNAVSAVPGVGEAYLSQSEGDTISDDAVPDGVDAVTTKPGAKAEDGQGRPRTKKGLKRRRATRPTVQPSNGKAGGPPKAGDADPLAERRAGEEEDWGEEEIIDALEAVYFSHPDRYHDLPEAERERLRAWVSDNVTPRNVTLSAGSYQLKAIPERFFRERGDYDPYVSNADIKGALLAAGYEPAWSDPIEMGFRVGPRPGSDWAAKPNGPRVLGPSLFYAWRRLPGDPPPVCKETNND
jgi:hypothetical protein